MTTRYEKHRKRCEQEATRDVVFLFQRRRWEVIGYPDGYASDGEGVRPVDDNGEFTDEGEYLTNKQLSEMTSGDYDVPCALERWDVEGVWLDRDEAEQYGRDHAYNYPDGWRVYGVPSYGQLASMLRGKAVPA